MSELAPLQNSGAHIIGDSPSGDKTIVVLGIARSGTSPIAGALAHLGLFLGNSAVTPVYEDKDLGELIESGQHDAARALINNYTATYGSWGFKRPAALHHLDFVHAELPNPRYIVVFRDIFSIANRNRISMQSNLVKQMSKSLNEYRILVDFLEEHAPHALLLSNEKTVSNSAEVITRLSNFAELEPSEDDIQAATDFIVPNPETYLEVSRTTRSFGKVEGFTHEAVRGWAHYATPSWKERATVLLLVEGNEIGRVEANLPSPDLTNPNFPTSGSCRFEFRFTEPLEPGVEVRLRVADDVRDIGGSPLVTPA